MLVLKVDDNANWRELYYGPFRPVKETSTYSKRDNKDMIPVGKASRIKEQNVTTSSQLTTFHQASTYIGQSLTYSGSKGMLSRPN